jgi:uncharacterized phage protein gp47/JayE
MANTPTPRSFNQILGQMVSTFLSSVGLQKIRATSPFINIMQAAAQSDFRATKDQFDILNTRSLDAATGTQLDAEGADDDLPRLGAVASTGVVTVTDSSITKISTVLSPAVPAPIVGSVEIYVSDASGFTNTGSLYIGRGTTNYEGPIPYTTKTQITNYWKITLSTPTTSYHNPNETVILAQAGDRVVAAQTVVQTTQGNITDAVQFSTLFPVVLPDGEDTLTNVQTQCTQAGVVGNVALGAISAFVSSPFTGAAVTNPSPYSNGADVESDDDYRERIRTARQTKTRGTALAITSAVLGLTSADEAGRISSSSLVQNQDGSATLYIDDGTGYEEKWSGVGLEILVDSAVGGEEFLTLSSPTPITKAFLVTSTVAPFTLADDQSLSVSVGGEVTTHTFSATDFRAITNASAYEVTASINGDANLGWSAKTVDGGNQVIILAKTEADDDIQVTGGDANSELEFTTRKAYTLSLFKNDKILYKDGKTASLKSLPISEWGVPTNGIGFIFNVDNTGYADYYVSDIDFVTAKTGYSSVGTNSLAAWAAVLNSKVPGMTTTVEENYLVFTSNAGATVNAYLGIGECGAVSTGMVSVGVSAGQPNDFTFDRNTGELHLTVPLTAGDRLTAGLQDGRGFVQSSGLTVATLASDAQVWFNFDGAAQIVDTTVNSSTTIYIDIQEYLFTIGVAFDMRITAEDSFPFVNVEVGDTLILWDPALPTDLLGSWKINAVGSDGSYINIDTPTSAGATESFLLSNGGLVVVRATDWSLPVTVPTGGPYTVSNIVGILNEQLIGGAAEVYRTTDLRVSTNTLAANGNVALVAQNTAATSLGLSTTSAVPGDADYVAVVESGNSGYGTTSFNMPMLAAATSTTLGLYSDNVIPDSGAILGMDYRSDLDLFEFGPHPGNAGFNRTFIQTGGADEIVVRDSLGWDVGHTVQLRSPYSFGPQDGLSLILNQDPVGSRFTIPMYRRVRSVNTVPSTLETFLDEDNGGGSLTAAFGLDYDFSDFVMYAAARSVSHPNDTTKAILWRFGRIGPDGNQARLAYVYPTGPDESLTVTSDNIGGNNQIYVSLPSTVAKTGIEISSRTKIGVETEYTGLGWQVTYLLGYPITSATRVGLLHYTGRGTTQFSGTITGNSSTATATVLNDSLAAGSSGAGVLTITNVSGTFLISETIYAGSVNATVSGSIQGYVTLTLGFPGGVVNITNHGLADNENLYLDSVAPTQFPSGMITVQDYTDTTISYTDLGTFYGTIDNVGTVSYDTQPASLASVSPSLAVGDLFTFGTNTGMPSALTGVTASVIQYGPQYITAYVYADVGSIPVPVWYSLTNVSGFTIFGVDLTASTAAAIVASVNSLFATPNTTYPVRATVLGSGAGTITLSSADEDVESGYYWFYDGVNGISVVEYPATLEDNYQFVLKHAPDFSYDYDSDWENEDIRLVPVTIPKVVSWLSNPAVTSLSNLATITASSQAKYVQIVSDTIGAAGAIQVQGGTANSATAVVVGAGSYTDDYTVFSVEAGTDAGFVAGNWVKIQNEFSAPKDLFTTYVPDCSIQATGLIHVDSAVYTEIITPLAGETGKTWQVSIQGDFICYTTPIVIEEELRNPNKKIGSPAPVDLSAVTEGSWVRIFPPSFSIDGFTSLSTLNQGNFRVVKVQADSYTQAFWVVNPNATAEQGTADLYFLAFDSMMPGDVLAITNPVWGTANVGSWIVTTVGKNISDPSELTSPTYFTVDVSNKAITPITYGGVGVPNPGWIQVLEETPTTLYKQIQSIIQNSSSGSLIDFKVFGAAGYGLVSEALGTVVYALDKFGFPTDLITGVDAYDYNTGLIQEASDVLYGDQADTATYPGVIAEGAKVSISGPLVKRLTFSLSVRARSNTTDVVNRIKSAVATVVNQTGVGMSIPLSSVVSAASKVSGVVSVSLIQPIYNSGNDLIPIQPYEKPMVLNPLQDVTVSFVGT